MVDSRLRPKKVAMDILGLGLTKFHDEVNKGRLQIVKNGRRTFVEDDELIRYKAALPRLGRKGDDVAIGDDEPNKSIAA